MFATEEHALSSTCSKGRHRRKRFIRLFLFLTRIVIYFVDLNERKL